MWPQVLEPEAKRPTKHGDWHSPSNGKCKTLEISPNMWHIFGYRLPQVWFTGMCKQMWLGVRGSLSGPKWRIASLNKSGHRYRKYLYLSSLNTVMRSKLSFVKYVHFAVHFYVATLVIYAAMYAALSSVWQPGYRAEVWELVNTLDVLNS